MCSILGVFGLRADDDRDALRRKALERSQRQRHRGPDWSGVQAERYFRVRPVGSYEELCTHCARSDRSLPPVLGP